MPVINNYWKECQIEGLKLKFRRLIAFSLLKAKKYNRCLRFITTHLIYQDKSSTWTWELLSQLYYHVTKKNKVLKNLKYKLVNSIGENESKYVETILANALLHKENKSAVRPYW